MRLEFHVLQNFAPSNLNRDDTGSPKSCEFGGVRRARISSQCIKRALRQEFKAADLIPAASRAVRSKRIVKDVSDRMIESGRDAERTPLVVEAALGLMGIKLKGEGKTEYLLYLGHEEINRLEAFCQEHWDALAAMSPNEGKAKGKNADASVAALAKSVKWAKDGGRAADLALFGRMLADLPEANVDAASQVAHALSTHQVAADFDYYTAVDDLQPDDTSGADMIGTVEFNSACYYRYANIDVAQLRENLSGDDELVRATIEAFLVATRDAIPTGKQNSFAAQNPPSLVFVVARDRGAWSLANAFVSPVRAGRDGGLVQLSAKAMDTYWGELIGMYGVPKGGRFAVATLGTLPLDALKEHQVTNFAELTGTVLSWVGEGA